MITYEQFKGKYQSTLAPKGFKEFTRKHGEAHPNTCAVRLSYALFLIDRNFFSNVKAKSGVEWLGLPTKASDLAIILNRKIKKAELIKSKALIKDKTGIIFFDKIVGFDGTGHISLWNGKNVVDKGDYFGFSPRIYFWNIPFKK